MLKKLLLILILPLSLQGHSLSNYFDLFTTYPDTLGPTGSWKEGEIEVILEPKHIHKIEAIAKNRLVNQGASVVDAESWSRVGIVAEDQYLYWIRDAVIFPSGAKGTYDRIISKNGLGDSAGVAIFGVLENQTILLNLNYRHATRSWEIELPRGIRKKNESIEDTVKRELKEETGGEVETLTFLGMMTPDTGILTSAIPVYAAKVSHVHSNHQDDSEAIETNLALTLSELKRALAQGYLETLHNGRTIKATVRDSFLTFALSQFAF